MCFCKPLYGMQKLTKMSYTLSTHTKKLYNTKMYRCAVIETLKYCQFKLISTISLNKPLNAKDLICNKIVHHYSVFHIDYTLNILGMLNLMQDMIYIQGHLID